VLNYPEIVTGKRTTPRTLTQFFQQIASISDLKADLDYIRILASSALDDSTVGAFLSFVNDELAELVSPEDVLEAQSFTPVKKRIQQLSKSSKGVHRIDRLSAICTRIFLYLTSERYRFQPRHQENLISFLTEDLIPNDLRMAMVIDLLKHGSEQVVGIIKDKRLSFLLIEAM
jgi:hypothetical protein